MLRAARTFIRAAASTGVTTLFTPARPAHSDREEVNKRFVDLLQKGLPVKRVAYEAGTSFFLPTHSLPPPTTADCISVFPMAESLDESYAALTEAQRNYIERADATLAVYVLKEPCVGIQSNEQVFFPPEALEFKDACPPPSQTLLPSDDAGRSSVKP